MVTILKKVYYDFNKNLFLKELHLTNGINVKVTKITEPKPSMNKEDNYIYVDFEILEDFEGCFKETGEKENIKGQIIGLPFTLNKKDEKGNYKINPKKNIFSILNYGLIKKGMIPEGNKNGFLINYNEIKEALTDLEFKAISTLVKSNSFNNYLKLDVKE